VSWRRGTSEVPWGGGGSETELEVCSLHTTSSGLAEMPQTSQHAGATGLCMEATPMDAGWVVEVGGLLLVSPTGIKKKTPNPTLLFFSVSQW